MSNLVAKLAILSLCLFAVFTQTTIPQPDPSWDDYKIKSCCPKDFIEVKNYCVQCSPPNVFDSIDLRCRPCPADHTYNPQTKSCDCKAPVVVAPTCVAPRILNNNVCECPADQKGIKRVWNEAGKSCECPSNLPLWNGKYCVACPAGTEFDPKEKQCYHCPDGFIRDINSHNCVPGL
jgi:hypothetical protein